MADKDINNRIISQAAATTVTTDLPYLAKAYGMPEDTVKEFLAAPTTEMVQQFLAVAQTIAQERDKLKTGAKEFIFRFMDLPAELRLKIYDLYFHARCLSSKLGLLHTSHIIRSEALPAAIKIAKILKETARKRVLACPNSSQGHFMSRTIQVRQNLLRDCYDDAEEVLRGLEMLRDGKQHF